MGYASSDGNKTDFFSGSVDRSDGSIAYFDASDQITAATRNRMSCGSIDLVKKAGFIKVQKDASILEAIILADDSVLEFEADELVSADMVDTAHNKGMLRKETVGSVPGMDWTPGHIRGINTDLGPIFDMPSSYAKDTMSVRRCFYYDRRGNVIQLRELSSDGWAACYSTRYDFAGNVTGTIESHTSPTGETHRVKTELTLDKRGNVLRERIYADGTLVTDTEYTYDELMRPTGRVTTGSGGSVLTETTTIDIRGWRTAHSASRRGEALYSQELAYMNPSQGAAPRWTGLISEATTAQLGSSPNTFGYTYDSAGRLTAAGSAKGSENGIRYDANGNMTALRRLPAAGSATADLTMAYSGNRLASVTNSGAEQPGSFSYEYDSNGNMTKDSRKSLEFTHNVLNLPMTASSLAGSTVTNTMTYTHLGDGTRVGARVSNPDATGHSGMRYRGFITDHLGNVAAVVNLSAPASTSNANVILEQGEYYPFGTRYYDAFVGRWNAIDPLAHKYFGMSPYNYCGNDPVNKFDPLGDLLLQEIQKTNKHCFIMLKNNALSIQMGMITRGTMNIYLILRHN